MINCEKKGKDFFFQGFGTLDFEIIWKESLNVLTITLLRARNLRSCDSNGLSDPYVKLHIVPGVAKVSISFSLHLSRLSLFDPGNQTTQSYNPTNVKS